MVKWADKKGYKSFKWEPLTEVPVLDVRHSLNVRHSTYVEYIIHGPPVLARYKETPETLACQLAVFRRIWISNSIALTFPEQVREKHCPQWKWLCLCTLVMLDYVMLARTEHLRNASTEHWHSGINSTIKCIYLSLFVLSGTHNIT